LNEECDEGSSNGLPQSDCDVRCKYVRLPECGDGTVNPETELCDEGSNNGNYAGALCRENCMLPRCGDGILDPNEECDDANNLSGDGCDKFCMYERRGAPVAGTTTVPPPVRPYVPGQNPQNLDEVLPPGVQIPTPAKTPTGPGLAIFLASGAAAGWGAMRKRKK
jgi:cysteine-rich repeat protein